MTKIAISGSSGFVGQNIVNYLSDSYELIPILFRESNVKILLPPDVTTVIHLVGKAHDLKKTSNPQEYYDINTEMTKKIFEIFLSSNATTFITLSSVKAVADSINTVLTEEIIPNPSTHYGKSKLLAEEYIFSKSIQKNKRVYVLRPCMIHGKGNKGNLNLLYQITSKRIPYPLGLFENRRSLLSVENLGFIVKKLISKDSIPSGIYNVADDESISTNDIINVMCEELNVKSNIYYINKLLIQFIAKLGNIMNLPLNEERLQKLTENYEVSNAKIMDAIGENLPLTCKDGLRLTIKSFSDEV